ncbi:hypothetical protein Y032_0113g371 [Ancylostoma ceylanicum]|uniref:Uncharacterized protein n=1 Tax=Ancylostoma ceylanicum TaxID=53326 RepID=A0A016TDE5_9BILA|nr:hypothetical protein Y032_0113g371 [Ancylostoma ceylanicum]
MYGTNPEKTQIRHYSDDYIVSGAVAPCSFRAQTFAKMEPHVDEAPCECRIAIALYATELCFQLRFLTWVHLWPILYYRSLHLTQQKPIKET